MNPLAPQLAAYDRLVRKLAAETARLESVPDEMQAVHEEYTAARLEIDQLAATADAAKHERVTREGAVAEAQEKLRKFQQQVSQVRNQREYGALLAEIDGAKAALRELEDGVLDLLEHAEATQKELAERGAGFGDLEARHTAALAAWESKKPEVASAVGELERQAGEQRSALPRQIVAQYERLRERFRGEALALMTSTERAGGTVLWHCSSCNYQVRPQVALEIRTRGALVQCDGCSRFLISDESA